DRRKRNVEVKVGKNPVAKRALAGTKYEGRKAQFKGPIAVTLSFSDVVFPAKTLDEFVRTNEGKGLKILGGSLGGKALSAAEIKDLASLPSLEVGRSML